MIMPKISSIKEEKIKEEILNYLFHNSPTAIFTATIAQELARDEEYVKKLLQELELKEVVSCIDKNPKGIKYNRRQRWTMDSKVYNLYKKINDQKAQLMNSPLKNLGDGFEERRLDN